MERGWQYRGLTANDVATKLLRSRGLGVPNTKLELITAAMATAEMSGLLARVADAQVRSTYSEGADSTRGWIIARDRQSFLAVEAIRIAAAELEVLPRGGQATPALLADATESFQVARFARTFSVDAQDIADGGLDRLLDLVQVAVLGASRTRKNLIYSVLLANTSLDADSTALFHSDHSNLGTGVLGTASLEDGLAAIAKQQDTTVNPSVNLNLLGRYLIVPSALRIVAMTLVHDIQVADDA
ncbi:unnamed protein product, partial [marine sediment metagenome]